MRKLGKDPAAPQTAVIYARYSSHAQKDESIEQQVEECMAFAKTNGLNVIEVYADKAISGKTDRRTSFQRLLRDAEKRKFGVVIAYKSNRIARNMLNALQYEAKLDTYGIKTVYAKEEFGDTAAGRFALRTMMNINQFYSENLAEDVKRGMMDNASMCKVNGRLPLGYVRSKEGYYQVDDAEAAIVREIFDKYKDGIPFVDIANELNGRGIKTKQGNLWNKNSFHTLLANTNYIGVYHYSDVVIEDGVPPIISKEVFAIVQDNLQKKAAANCHRKNADFLLTGKLFCGHCGSYMVGTSGTGKSGDIHFYYSCQGRRTGNGCQKDHVRRDWLELEIAKITKEIVLKDDTIEWIADNAISFQQQARRESGIGRLEQELSEKRKAQKNVMSAIEAGIYTATTKDRLIEIETSISELSRKLAIENAKNEPISKTTIVYILQSFKDGNVEDKSYQKQLIDSFVKSVYLYDDHIKIEYYYAGKDTCRDYPLEEETPPPDDEVVCSYTLPLGSPQETQANPPAVIYLTAGGFVLDCPLHYSK